MDLINPAYNILPLARSALGVKRTQETRLKMSQSKLNDPSLADTKARTPLIMVESLLQNTS
jgi:hypothetical protein